MVQSSEKQIKLLKSLKLSKNNGKLIIKKVIKKQRKGCVHA